MAEYRELPMVAGALRRSLSSKKGDYYRHEFTNARRHYTLNSGHVKFFYDKKKFLMDRYDILKEELRNRGFSLDENRKVDWDTFDKIDKQCTSWSPRPLDILTNVERIKMRIDEKPDWYRWYGNKILYSDYTDCLLDEVFLHV